MASKKCLMIQTKDKRKFFTHEKNYEQLIEFSKIFGANISVIRTKDNPEILELKELAPALCNDEYKSSKIEIELVENKIIGKKDRKSIIDNAKIIRKFIKNKFLRGELVSIKLLKEKYFKYNMTTACYCNHLSSVRKELEKEGYVFEKIGGGEYQLIKSKT